MKNREREGEGEGGGGGGGCVAFIVNHDSTNTKVVVQFRNSSYELPPSSISILPDCVAEAFNTAKVSTQSRSRSIQPIIKFDSIDRWVEFSEVIPSYDETSVRSDTLLEHMNTTKDKSDYLWYTISFEHESSVEESTLSVYSWGDVLHAFVNGVLAGSAHGFHKNSAFTLNSFIHLNQGTNNISLLSATVGLPDSGAFLERRAAGLYRVTVGQDNQETQDLTNSSWGYQVGMRGEILQLYNEEGSSGVEWRKFDNSSKFLTWYKTKFDAPGGDDPLALNLGSMGKGEVWINGQSIGRYWISFRKNDGSPSQTWYHVPRSFLKPTNNQIVLFEEEEGNPTGISLDTVSIITKVCRHVISDTNLQLSRRSRAHLSCPPNTKISKILFASFGNPIGNCQSYALGKCHSSNSTQIVQKECIGRRRCNIPKLYKRFGGDPCPGIPKALLIEAQCQ